MMKVQSEKDPSTLDSAEVEAFARLAEEWWDPHGKFRPLHRLGPTRLSFIRSRLVEHFNRPTERLRPLEGLTVLDIGCGGGLVCEPVARMGAAVTGIDPARESIEAARRHAGEQGLEVTYRAATVEDMIAAGVQFDAVLCLEVIEHVPHPAAFLALCAQLVRPGGLLVASTINRTIKAWLLAIVGAEYVLRWLPVGTHRWERFVTPDELARYLTAVALVGVHTEGMVYDPLEDSWSLSADTDVNYLMSAAKQG